METNPPPNPVYVSVQVRVISMDKAPLSTIIVNILNTFNFDLLERSNHTLKVHVH